MDLKDFVAESLAHIVEGVAAATDRVEAQGGFINPADDSVSLRGKAYAASVVVPGHGTRVIQLIEFDLAVVVTRDEKAKVGGGVVTVVSGNLETEHARQTTSRIKFSVPITLPLHPGTSRKDMRSKSSRKPDAHPPQPPAPPGPSP
jgi:hypothetical protein